MISKCRTCLLTLGFGAALGAAAQAQSVHHIRVEGDPKREVYRFSPATVSARAGDVLLFEVKSGQPHSIVFEGAELKLPAREALNAAMPRRAGDLSSPLLTSRNGQYRITLPDLPPGRYAYYCLPHRAYDMRGEIVVNK